MELDRRCTRCGRSEHTEEERERIELALLMHDGKVPGSDALPSSRLVPSNWLYDSADGPACWDCLTQQERRREESRCERCGAQFHDDGRDSDAGWIIPGFGPVDALLCPQCQTPDEDEAHARSFIALVERWKALRASGRREPHAGDAEHEVLAEQERDRIEKQRQNVDMLNRLVAGDEAVE
jgi:hypothetical protein